MQKDKINKKRFNYTKDPKKKIAIKRMRIKFEKKIKIREQLRILNQRGELKSKIKFRKGSKIKIENQKNEDRIFKKQQITIIVSIMKLKTN